MAVVTAIIPLNKFRNIATNLSTDSTVVYETPDGVSSIILSAACSNKSSSEVSVTVFIEKANSASANTTFTEYSVVPSMAIPPHDVLSATSGRLVLEHGKDFVHGDRIVAYSSANNAVDFVISMNEAANE